MRPLLLLLLALVPAAAALAQGPAPGIAAREGETGWVAVTLTGAPNATVAVSERVGEAVEPLGQVTLDGSGRAERPRLTAWRCDRRSRVLEVRDAAGLTATTTVATPSCRERLSMTVRPRAPRARRPIAVTVYDRWSLGDLAPRVCARGPGDRRCRRVRFTESDRRAGVRFRPVRAGRWRFTMRAAGAPSRREAVQVRPRSGGVRILATGDSMIQYIDTELERRLERGRTRVRRESHISTGISKPAMFDWMRAARRQAATVRPDATVVYLGANDGFPIRGAQCCGDGWVEGYATRARAMMRAYARHGAGAVYWLLLPVPAKAHFKPVYRAVNRAIRLAARRYPGVVRVVDLEALFTPGGRYRASMRWRGSVRRVRQADGVHLNPTGAAIAATVIIRAMRRDGVLALSLTG